MTAGWVAAATRGSALVRRLPGPVGARELAAAGTWAEARDRLATTFYGTELATDADRAGARHAAASATVWQLRVLVGWLPVGMGGVARLFAAPLEIANIESHLSHLNGATPTPRVSLGSLAVAWPRAGDTTSPQQLRTLLRHSPWGDPGGIESVTVAMGLKVAWARRLIGQLGDEASTWAKGALAVLIAREVFAFERTISPTTARELDRLVGADWRHATTIPELARLLPDSAAWALTGLSSPSELWRAELEVARRVATDASRLAVGRQPTKGTVAAMMALMLVDLWRITAAIEVAGRSPYPAEVFDVVA